MKSKLIAISLVIAVSAMAQMTTNPPGTRTVPGVQVNTNPPGVGFVWTAPPAIFAHPVMDTNGVIVWPTDFWSKNASPAGGVLPSKDGNATNLTVKGGTVSARIDSSTNRQGFLPAFRDSVTRSVNGFELKRTIANRAYQTNGLNIGIVGDSMPWRFLRYLDPYLAARYGTNGFAFGTTAADNNANSIGYIETPAGGVMVNRGNATNTTYSTLAFAQLEAGESLAWTNHFNPRGWVADTVAVYYRLESGGGVFKIQVATNGGAFADVLSVSCDNATVGGAATNVTLPLNQYMMRVVGVSGVSRVHDGGIWDSTSTGVRSSWIASGGINMVGMLAHSNQYQNVWSKLDLDTVFIQLKDAQDITTNAVVANWPNFEQLLMNSFPSADIVLVSSTPQQNDDHLLEWQDEYWRERALLNGWAYVDLRTPLVSFASQTNYGLSDSLGVHPLESGSRVITARIIQDLGFEALPEHRTGTQTEWYLWPHNTVMALSGSGGNTNRAPLEQVQSHLNFDRFGNAPGAWVSGLPFTNTFPVSQTRYTWMLDRAVTGKNWRIEPLFATTNADNITFNTTLSALRLGKSEFKEEADAVMVGTGTNLTWGSKLLVTTNNPASVQAYHISVGGYNGLWTHTNRVLLLGVRVVNW
jgi:hypothetical protein